MATGRGGRRGGWELGKWVWMGKGDGKGCTVTGEGTEEGRRIERSRKGVVFGRTGDGDATGFVGGARLAWRGGARGNVSWHRG
ncbi:UNVERIFIED_CONTAM: hypothetical protein Sradi_5985500 [Sesamum radiatum]|uniref:Uncharacterized protein n=1 Tax=Sesamum radiatum TaxID=300843 RepID=A0AAW2KGV9_SESRA